MAQSQSDALKNHFHRYFEGYTDSTCVTPGGAVKVVKVYTAPYWVHDLTDAQWRGQKLRFALLLGGAWALYIAAAFLPAASNHWAPVGLPAGLALAALVFLTGGTASYLTCPRRMTIYEHKHSGSSVRRWSLLTALGMAIAGAMSALYLPFSGGQGLLPVLGSGACYLACAGAVYVIYRTECATEYYEEENDNIV